MTTRIAGLSFPDFTPGQELPVPVPGLPDSIDDLLGNGLSALEQGMLSRTLDGLTGLVRDAGDRVAGLATQVRDQLAALPHSAANAVADSMRGASQRSLTAGETAAVRKAFGDDIDLSNVRIVNGPGRNPDAWTAFNIGGNPAITEGNTVYVRTDHYGMDFSTSPRGINTLVHEFTHVRQFQKMGFGSFFGKYAGDLATIGDRNKLYDYASRTNHFRNETIEGQAAMVGDYAQYRADPTSLAPAKAKAIEVKLAGTGIFGL